MPGGPLPEKRLTTATTAVTVVVAGASLLAGCTGSSESSSPAAAYTQPAWMVQAAQQNELHGEAMVECLGAAGYEYTANPEGGVSGKVPEFASKEESDAQAKSREAEIYACNQEVEARLGFETQLSDAQQYAQMTDTLACLRAQGYTDLGDPPSEAAWTDAFHNSGDLWSPYGQLYAADPDISEAEWNGLKAVCVEGGVIFGMSFRDETP